MIGSFFSRNRRSHLESLAMNTGMQLTTATPAFNAHSM